MPDPFFDPARTALLAMDFQSEIVEMTPMAQERAVVSKARAVVQECRKAGMPVVYVVVSFRDGYPEVSVSNRAVRAIRDSGRLREGSRGVEVHPDLAPQPGDVVVTKRRGSAFYNTDLEVILRARGIDTLALMGIATGGVVLSTVRYAADADYKLIVLEDCCADRDAEAHRVLTSNVFPRQAQVTTAQEFLRVVESRS